MTFLGYTFTRSELLEEALTTPSYRMDYPGARDNQRLEFLGDAVLGLLSGELLYEKFPHDEEGSLTVRRTHMVSSAALCAAANRIGLVPLLKRSRGAAPLNANSKALADAIEAIIGAAYLDGGFEGARTIFNALELQVDERSLAWNGNPKGELQIRAQAMKPPRHPIYTLLNTTGKAHEPIFTVSVEIEGVGKATASARSHKEAEAQAATKLLSDASMSWD